MELSEEELHSVISLLISGDFVIGSDGSVAAQVASYSALIQDKSNVAIFINLSSKLLTQSSYIAEGFGYLALLYLLWALTFYFHIPYKNTTVSAYIDNSGLLSSISNYYTHKLQSIKFSQRSGADIVREIVSVEQSLPVLIERHHVKSHTHDQVSNLEDLPVPQLINRKCDVSAGLAYNDPTCPTNTTVVLPSNFSRQTSGY